MKKLCQRGKPYKTKLRKENKRNADCIISLNQKLKIKCCTKENKFTRTDIRQ